MIEAFDVLNEGSAWAAGIAHPAIFATDPKGVIAYRFSEKEYSVRPEIDDVLEALKE